MSILRQQKEKESIRDLMTRVESFAWSVEEIYKGAGEIGVNSDLLLTSVMLKMKAGERLREEITGKAREETDGQSKALLEQLLLSVSNECTLLAGMQQAVQEYRSAEKQGDLIAREETLRKLKTGMMEYAGGQGRKIK